MMEDENNGMQWNAMSRRDFLKVLGAASLGLVKWPRLNWGMPGGQAENQPNILVVVFDALSARNMSLYGYPRRTTPNLERVAQKARVYHRHYAGGNFTSSGTASLLSGTYPWLHRALHYRGMVTESYIHRQVFSLLAPLYHSFAYSHNYFPNILFDQYRLDIDEWKRLSDLCLRSYSYSDRFLEKDFSVAYLSEGAILRNLNGPTTSFYMARFDRVRLYLMEQWLARQYRQQFPRGVPNYLSIAFFTIEQAIDWLQMQIEEQPKPFLGYFHLLPPHYPYVTRHEFVDIFDDGWQPPAKPTHYFYEGQDEAFLTDHRRLYDEYIAYVDAEFGRLYDAMEHSGALENTILVFTSDHGEMFERGIFQHNTPTLYEPLIHVPLLIWTPEQRERLDIHMPTNCVDVLPTLLDLAGQAAPEWIEGVRLPGFAQAPVDEQRSIYVMDAKENAIHAPLTRATLALIKGRYKLIHYLGYPGHEDVYELYDLESDPEELVDQYENLVEIAAELRSEMAQKLVQVNQPYLS